MHDELDRLLASRGGAVSRQRALAVLTRNQLDHQISSGRLRAPFPRAYCRPWDCDDPAVLRRAALASVGEPVALSHTSALCCTGVLDADDADAVHVLVPAGRHPLGRAPGLTVHRTRRPTRTRFVDGCRTVEPSTAIVQSWPLLAADRRRAPAIDAVRGGLVSAQQLRRAATDARSMPGRADFLGLVGLLEAGCQSELEIWGLLGVFDVPGLGHGVRQLVVRVGARRYRLDLAFEVEKVAVELDGDRFHSTREQREADRRRDAALAAAGWLTLRFTWRRLHVDVDGCRRDALATLAARQPWLRSG